MNVSDEQRGGHQGEGLMVYQEESMNLIQDILSEGVTLTQLNNLLELSNKNARGYANEHIKKKIYIDNNLFFLNKEDFFVYKRPKIQMSERDIDMQNRRQEKYR